MELHPDHPDANARPGDQRTDGTGRLWTFGTNQYASFWRAGPKDGTVTCSKDYPGLPEPYRVGGVACKDFDKAAARSRASARTEYEQAKRIVDRYEASE